MLPAGGMIVSNGAKSVVGSNCLMTTLASNSSSSNNEQQQQVRASSATTTTNERTTLSATPTPTPTPTTTVTITHYNSSQVSSDNENSSNHSTTWPPRDAAAIKRPENTQKLNLILPQQQQQQHPISGKNCLTTPVVITTDGQHLGQQFLVATPNGHQQQAYVGQATSQFCHQATSHQQQLLIDSLAHQLNGQGGEVSLFTGLPSCTPASADRLAASSINPFFWNATTAANAAAIPPTNSEILVNGNHAQANTTTTNNNNNDEHARSSWGVDPNTSQVNGGSSKPNNNNNNNNNSTNGYAANSSLAKGQTLTLADLHAASGLSPIILSPLSFLGLSPEQEAWLRYGYVSPTQHPLAGRSFTQADLNHQLNTHHHHQHHHHHQQQQHQQQQEQHHAAQQPVGPFNQMYHQGQRAESLNTHHLQQQQQQQQQQHQPELHQYQNQVAKDLTQQTAATANQLQHPQQQATCTSLISTNTGLYQQSVAQQQQHHHHQHHHQRPPSLGAGANITYAHQQAAAAAAEQFMHQASKSASNAAADRANQRTNNTQHLHLQQEQARLQAPSSQSKISDGKSTSVVAGSRVRETNTQQGPEPMSLQTIAHAQPIPIVHQDPARPLQQPLSQLEARQQTSGRPVSVNGTRSGSPMSSAFSSALSPGSSHHQAPIGGSSREHSTRASSSRSSNHSLTSGYDAVSPSAASTSDQEPPETAPTPTGHHSEASMTRSRALDEVSCSLSLESNRLSIDDGRAAVHKSAASPSDDPARKQTARANKSNEFGALSKLHDGGSATPKQKKSGSNQNQSQSQMQSQKKLLVGGGQDLAVAQHAGGLELPAGTQSEPAPVKKKSRGGRKKKLVTHEEMLVRKNRSKERNRVAARRCRQKRKQFLDELRDKIDHLNDLNQSLQKENSMLKGELESFKQHHRVCSSD